MKNVVKMQKKFFDFKIVSYEYGRMQKILESKSRRSWSKADDPSKSRRSFVKANDLQAKPDDPGRKRTILFEIVKI